MFVQTQGLHGMVGSLGSADLRVGDIHGERFPGLRGALITGLERTVQRGWPIDQLLRRVVQVTDQVTLGDADVWLQFRCHHPRYHEATEGE